MLRLKEILNIYSFMPAEQTSAGEDYVIQAKAPEQAKNWTLIRDCFISCVIL